MKTRLIFIALCLLWPISARAELTAKFTLDKTTFVPGEPVFLNLTLVNTGAPQMMDAGAPLQEQPGCSGVAIAVSSDEPDAPLRGGCSMNGPRQMAWAQTSQTSISRFLLNFGHEISEPGNYWVEASFLAKSKTRLAFRIDGKAQPWDRSHYQPWIDQLHSDPQTSMDAALTLASLGPRSLEDLLLGFATSPLFRRYAPLAFHRLNTQRSMQAMFELMQGPVTNEQVQAVRYLAATGDQQYFPTLLDAAKMNPGINDYPISAAELGGDKMLPVLVEIERSPDRRFAHVNAIQAMGSTGSRAAVPILLDLLNSAPDVETAQNASYALQQLTRRSVIQDWQHWSIEVARAKWSRWWQAEGQTAPIYNRSETGHWVPLP